jgi:uncharacterized membrane protein YdbT with pleckstrin-like domain
VHLVVHVGHLRLLHETGANIVMVGLAVLANLAAIVLSVIYLSRSDPRLLLYIAGFFIVALIVEFILRTMTGRTVRARVDNRDVSVRTGEEAG